MDFMENTIVYIGFIKRVRAQMLKRLKRLPKGKMVEKHSRGKTYFYVKNDGRLKSLLGNQHEYELYCEKEYLLQTLKKIEKNLPLLENLATRYQPITMWDKNWQTLGSSQNEYNGENKRHFFSGTYYRSKSELAIAMMLSSYELDFKYESEVFLGGKKVYPDFAIRRPKDEKIIFWEHFGLTGNEDYREKMYEKIEKYRASGLDIWDSVILSFETEDGSLNGDTIDKLIRTFIL